MRIRSISSTLLVLGLTLGACSGTGADPGDDDPTPDAATVDPPIDPPARGFQVVSKKITIEPGQEITYCYYFRTPNTEAMAINKWKSVMTPGSHHMIMFTTSSDVMPPGSVSSSNCGFGGGGSASNIPVWTYSAQTVDNEVLLPADDGAGKPVAQMIQPNTPAFFQMHYLNATDAPLEVFVTLNAEALAAGADFTQTAAYVTYNADIDIPADTANHPEIKTCDTPPGAKFWLMSTHAHKRATKTTVKNGMPASTTIAFESDDWEHPGAARWAPPQTPYYTFDGDKLTFECTYDNLGGPRTFDGDSAATEEMCMASGYYFPADAAVICYCVASGCYSF